MGGLNFGDIICARRYWMHCVFLGVVKYIMQLQMSDGNREKSFYLGAKKASISRQLLSIKPPDIVGRLRRSLEDLRHWKATELKNWLLHYSVAGLRNKLNALYAFHWSLLVGVKGMLCSNSISHEDLRHADSMLQDFVLSMHGNIIWADTMYNEHPPFATPCLLHVTKRRQI